MRSEPFGTASTSALRAKPVLISAGTPLRGLFTLRSSGSRLTIAEDRVRTGARSRGPGGRPARSAASHLSRRVHTNCGQNCGQMMPVVDGLDRRRTAAGGPLGSPIGPVVLRQVAGKVLGSQRSRAVVLRVPDRPADWRLVTERSAPRVRPGAGRVSRFTADLARRRPGIDSRPFARSLAAPSAADRSATRTAHSR